MRRQDTNARRPLYCDRCGLGLTLLQHGAKSCPRCNEGGKSYAQTRTRIGDTPDDGPDFDEQEAADARQA